MPYDYLEVHISMEEVKYLTKIVERLDTTLNDFQSLIINLDKMAAIQKERIDVQEQQTEVIHQRIHSMKREFIDEFKLFRKEVSQRLDSLDKDINSSVKREDIIEGYKRLDNLEKDVLRWRWIFSGIAAVLIFLVSVFQIEGLLEMIVK